MKSILLGAIACLLVLCQWFVFRSVTKYLWPNVERISRSVAYSALIGFGLLTILSVRLEFGSEIFPTGTIGPQLASAILRSYLGWVAVLSLFFLFVRLSDRLAALKNVPAKFARIKEIRSACGEDEIDRGGPNQREMKRIA